MMTYDEALSFIHRVNPLFCNPGLERVKALCEALGNPQDEMKFIHVAGTNGKGSTSAMLDSILCEAGYRVGLYTSPFILRFNERIRVDGKEIPDADLAKITEEIRPVAEAMEDRPTEFELITAIAFEYFRRRGCQIVVLECGLGGRFDATNIVKTTLLSLITGISKDHTAILGDTIEKIAWEKAGIIKPDIPVIFGGEDETASEVIEKEAEKCASPYFTVDHGKTRIKSFDLSGSVFDFGDWRDMKIKLLGTYQPWNASTVLTAVDKLRELGVNIPEDAVRRGLEKTRWAARFEIISTNPTVIFDGSHNAEGIRAAKESVLRYFGDKKVIVISGVLADKEYEKIAEDIAEIASTVYTITPENPRALTAEKYAEVINKKGAMAHPCKSIGEALTRATSEAKDANTAVVILGSLYTYGNVISELKMQNM
jgi:dihydrofolate synthase/folylpolyglutamate synthase